MQMAEKPDYKNLLIITVGLGKGPRAGSFAEFVKLHEKARVCSLKELKSW